MNNFSDFSMGDDFSMGGFDATVPTHPDKCTQCSICLKACPTYQISNDFNQSPMGRIKILRQKEEETTEEQISALESCLHCFNCETACPSQVNYRELIVDGFERLNLPRTEHLPVQTLHQYVESSNVKKLVDMLGRYIVPIVEAINPFRHTQYGTALKRVKSSILAVSKLDRKELKPDAQTVLLTGCMGTLLDGRTIKDAVDVLITVNPAISLDKNRCCGALHRHSGKKSLANDMATVNARHFLQPATKKIITISSACGDSLSHYPQWLDNVQSGIENIDTLVEKQTDIIDYLHQNSWQPEKTAPLPFRKILVHIPCSSNKSLSKSNLLDLLATIEGLEYDLLTSPYSCCGAGGTHIITHPDMAKKALEPILQDVREKQPDLIISSNIGCTVHIESGLQQNKISIPVLHPISFLRYFTHPPEPNPTDD